VPRAAIDVQRRVGDPPRDRPARGGADDRVPVAVLDERRRPDAPEAPPSAVRRGGDDLAEVARRRDAVLHGVDERAVARVVEVRPARVAAGGEHAQRHPGAALGAVGDPLAQERGRAQAERGRQVVVARAPAVVDCRTSAPTRAGWRRTSSWAIIPPSETPTTWARAILSWRRTSTASSAMVLVEKSLVAGSDSPAPRLSIVMAR
jgi:hypothetical protein